MKLLFEQNLSHRLPARLAEVFPQSGHVRLLGMDRASDAVIWEYAKEHGYTIVTQDSDFAERSKLHGTPPKVVWLRTGNTTPRHIESLLRAHTISILELTGIESPPFLEIF